MKQIFYVSSRSQELDGGIYGYRINENKKINFFSFNHIKDNNYMIYSKSKKYLFTTAKNKNTYQICSFKVYDNGELKLISQCNTGHHGGCHLAINANDSMLYVANYHTNTVIEISVGCGVLKQIERIIHYPKNSHPHCVKFSEDYRFLLVTLLGIDEIRVYKVSSNFSVNFANYDRICTDKSDGPRHLLFCKKFSKLFVINEISNSINTYSYNDESMNLIFQDKISTIANCQNNYTKAAAIIMTNNCKHLIVSNRGFNSLGVFTVSKEKLKAKSLFLLDGKFPRDVQFIDNNQSLLAVACEQSNQLLIVNYHNGNLSLNEQVFPLTKPVCILR